MGDGVIGVGALVVLVGVVVDVTPGVGDEVGMLVGMPVDGDEVGMLVGMSVDGALVVAAEAVVGFDGVGIGPEVPEHM